MVCIRHQSNDDEYVFNLGKMTWSTFKYMRDTYGPYFSIEKNHWDGGWGWKKDNSNYALGKMLASCYLLDNGIGGFSERRVPKIERLKLGEHAVDIKEPIVAIKVNQLVQNPDTVEVPESYPDWVFKFSHVFLTDINDRLYHYYERLEVSVSEWVSETINGEAIRSILAIIDEQRAVLKHECFSTTMNRWLYVSEEFNKDSVIWIFGRDFNGEVVVYYSEWYKENSQWESFNLSTILSIHNATEINRSDEIPVVIKSGIGLDNEIDIFVRYGFKLYHYWKSIGSALNNNWHGEKIEDILDFVNSDILDIYTIPVVVRDGKDHVFGRNQHGALMEYIYIKNMGIYPGKNILPCCRERWWLPRWSVRNVDNEIAGLDKFRDLQQIINYPNVEGELAAIKTDDGTIHVFQRKSSEPYGLLHYYIKRGIWCSQLLSCPAKLVSKPVIIKCIHDRFEFGFNVYVKSIAGELWEFSMYEEAEYVEGWHWGRENITRNALEMEDRVDINGNPVYANYSILNEVVPTIIKYEDLVVIDVFARQSNGYYIVRHQWTDRPYALSVWVAERVLNTYTIRSLPAVNNYEHMLEVFAFSNNNKVYNFREIRDRPWHSNRDYKNWAKGSEYDFEFKPKDSDDSRATAIGFLWDIQMKCPSFVHGPGARASTMVHEATHVNKYLRGRIKVFRHDHEDDPWYVHGLGQIPLNDLNPSNSNHKHYPYQIQIEWLADFGEFPSSQMIRHLWNNASQQADEYMTSKISVVPPWSPGEPRPL